MVIKLVLRPQSLSSTILFPNFLSKPSLPKLHIFSLFCTTSPSQTLNLAQPQTLSYGPSLHKGIKPFQKYRKEEEENEIIDEESFTRVFNIAAIRVPAKDCFVLENRLRGHLLNWPRIRNIARVPGDEIDEEVLNLLADEKSDSNGGVENDLVLLNRRIYGKAEGDGEKLSPVLYREKLAKEFNSRGFVKFRNLAKMSRPKRKNKRKEEEMDEEFAGKKRIGKNDFAVVEVLEENMEEEDLSGLLGDEFKGRKWKGSTRLLLLDECYAERGMEELPEAIKVAVPNILMFYCELLVLFLNYICLTLISLFYYYTA